MEIKCMQFLGDQLGFRGMLPSKRVNLLHLNITTDTPINHLLPTLNPSPTPFSPNNYPVASMQVPFYLPIHRCHWPTPRPPFPPCHSSPS